MGWIVVRYAAQTYGGRRYIEEIPCSSMEEAKEEARKLAEVGIHAQIDDSYYMPASMVSRINNYMGV